MKLLLDTHTFLWLLESPEKLSEVALGACKSREHQLFFSVVTGWEIQIKSQLGKLILEVPLSEMVESQQAFNELQVLPVTLDHVLELENLLPLHKDPFDRLLVAQARVENLHLVTGDGVISQYAVTVLW